MRYLAAILALVLCVSATLVQAAGGATTTSRARRSTAVQRVVRQGLSPAALQGLAGSITRDQQLAVLRSEPATAARLQKLGVSTVTLTNADANWNEGITLTPLAPVFPANADYYGFKLALETQSAYVSPWSPAPSASQQPPLLWLNTMWSSLPLITLDARWPSAGAYLLTFFMTDIWSESSARPHVLRADGTLQTLTPNTPKNATQWSLLWEVASTDAFFYQIHIYAQDDGLGFTTCALSKIVVTKL